MFKKITRNKLMQEVADQIAEAIINSKFRPGDKLPSMQTLQETLGASRGTIREALRVLEQRGLIEIRLGVNGGAFVRESTTQPISDGLGVLIRQRKISLDDLSEFRQVVESGLIDLVVRRMTKAQLDELKQILQDFPPQVEKGTSGWRGFLEVEVDLRKALIRIARNKVYEAVLVPIHENIFSYGHNYMPASASIKQAYDDWCEIINALEKRDVERATLITKNHIARYAKLMKRGMAESGK
jgi:DNA-binding FadR family transcriptional regulator